MPCGCVICDECPVCGELVYDDEWTIIGDVILHEECKDTFMANQLKCTAGQVRILNKQEQIKQDIADLREDMENTFDYYKSELKRLENLLESEVEQ